MLPVIEIIVRLCRLPGSYIDYYDMQSCLCLIGIDCPDMVSGETAFIHHLEGGSLFLAIADLVFDLALQLLVAITQEVQSLCQVAFRSS